MKIAHNRIALLSFPVLISLFLLPAARAGAKDGKMKPDELVAKHLASIGTPEAIAAVRSRTLTGKSQAIFRLPNSAQLAGNGSVISEGRKIRIALEFSQLDYPGERLVFDGSKVDVGQVRPGQRSTLSSFIYHYDVLLKEGLLGGSMTTAWALLDVPGRQPKLDYSGLKKVEGKDLHELRYRAKRGSSDMQISLFFDTESYRHVFSRIRLVVPASMGRTPTDSPGQRDAVYTIEESFGGFAEVNSITVPTAYKMVFTIEGQDQTVLAQFAIAGENLAHNQSIDPKTFVIN